VDVDKEGLEFSDYMRVRIELPLNRWLLAKFKTTINGQPGAKIYLCITSEFRTFVSIAATWVIARKSVRKWREGLPL
jgi:hypothetical protein